MYNWETIFFYSKTPLTSIMPTNMPKVLYANYKTIYFVLLRYR